jgi:hypothetical protein
VVNLRDLHGFFISSTVKGRDKIITAFFNETQASKAKRIEACQSNYPAYGGIAGGGYNWYP